MEKFKFCDMMKHYKSKIRTEQNIKSGIYSVGLTLKHSIFFKKTEMNKRSKS